MKRALHCFMVGEVGFTLLYIFYRSGINFSSTQSIDRERAGRHISIMVGEVGFTLLYIFYRSGINFSSTQSIDRERAGRHISIIVGEVGFTLLYIFYRSGINFSSTQSIDRERAGRHISIMVGEVGFEPTSLAAKDFKSFVYTIPPLALRNYCVVNFQSPISNHWILGIGYYGEAVLWWAQRVS